MYRRIHARLAGGPDRVKDGAVKVSDFSFARSAGSALDLLVHWGGIGQYAFRQLFHAPNARLTHCSR